MNILKVFVLGFFVFQASVLAQTDGAPKAPTDSAMDFSLAEMQRAASYLAEQGVPTRCLLEGGVFSVNVRHLEGSETALQHGRITEVWVIQEGSGILATGGTIVNAVGGGVPYRVI